MTKMTLKTELDLKDFGNDLNLAHIRDWVDKAADMSDRDYQAVKVRVGVDGVLIASTEREHNG